jgi:hypothetical protein
MLARDKTICNEIHKMISVRNKEELPEELKREKLRLCSMFKIFSTDIC